MTNNFKPACALSKLIGTGNYIYFEASSPVRTGESAVLRTPKIINGTASTCMKFAYHMHGETMGELKLEKLYPDGTRMQLFYNTEVEDAWKEQTIFLPMDTINYEVIIFDHKDSDGIHINGYEARKIGETFCVFDLLIIKTIYFVR